MHVKTILLQRPQGQSCASNTTCREEAASNNQGNESPGERKSSPQARVSPRSCSEPQCCWRVHFPEEPEDAVTADASTFCL